MSSYSIGHAAEERAARYLGRQGYTIRQLNWKTKYCEVDIIAEHRDCIFFVEVKYRDSSRWGTGLEYITGRKLRQMRFAAHMWMTQHHWSKGCRLAALSVDGNVFRLVVLD